MLDPIISPSFAAYVGYRLVLPMAERAMGRIGEHLGDGIVGNLRCDPGGHLRPQGEQIVLHPGANLIQFNGPVTVHLHSDSLLPNNKPSL